MVIPNERENKFLIIKDPLFVKNFISNNWSYMFYDEVEKIKSLNQIKDSDLKKYLKKREE